MTQNLLTDLLTALKARFTCTSMRSCCLLEYVYIGFRFARYQCFPWFVLMLSPFKLLFASEVERVHIQIRYFKAMVRIDFVNVYGLLNELLW